MDNLAIKVENVSKIYRLGQVGSSTIKHDFTRFLARMRGKGDPYIKIGETNDRASKANSDYVWALKDINFEVKEGDVLGIIGRNGAGKSTLLKILSRTTAPTQGNIKLNGRMASLLEVGTGFHPELTGRENLFLNGAILGMTRKEIRLKFDEIVDFSGVERYIDTPVKRYSSGMYVRLAFAIAAHLEPEILVVDEVLAVGDAEFQKKCLGKMKDVSVNKGRTVLFVSHSMSAVKQLCTKGIVINNGTMVYSGGAIDSVMYYQNTSQMTPNFEHKGDLETAPGNQNIRILKFVVQPTKGTFFSISTGIQFELTFHNNRPNINLDVAFHLKNIDETILFHIDNLITQNKDSKKGIYTVKGSIPPELLNAGIYKFEIFFSEQQRYSLYKHGEIVQFEVMNESIGANIDPMPGVIRPNLNFENIHLG